MKNLKFFDEGHRYELDGVELPSVSEISRFASCEVYGNDISKYVLDKACERGTAVHKATEELDKTGKCEILPEYSEYLNAYVKFRKDFNIKEYTYIEKPLADEEMGYAGTLDRVYKIDEDFAKAVKKHCRTDISELIGQYAIIDLKTSSTVKKQLAQIQLPAYSNLLCPRFVFSPRSLNCVGFLGILHLKKDGKYKLTPYEDNLSLFNACLTLHKAFVKKLKIKNK